MPAPLPSVLVVDDNADFLRVARTVLETCTPSFAVSTVVSAAEAVAFLRRRPPFQDVERPSFVVLDLRLPDLDASTVLAEMARRNGALPLPVLVLSQARWEEDDRAVMRAGATRFCVKPSSVRALRGVILDFYHQCVLGTRDGTTSDFSQADE